MSGDGHSRQQLVGFVQRIKRLRDEVRDLQSDVADLRKEAKAFGFDPTRIMDVVRWLEKVEKHGREAMDEAEAIYHLYRDVVDGAAKDFDAMMNDARDRALLKKFAPDDQRSRALSKRQSQVAEIMALQRAARESDPGSILK